MKAAMFTAVALVASTWLGCGDDSERNTPVAESAEAEAPEPVPAVDNPPAEPTPADGDAEAAYRAALEAYNAADLDTYISAFTDPICTREGASMTSDLLREARKVETGGVRSHTLQVLRSSADEVVLADFGVWYRIVGEEEEGVPLTRPFLQGSDEAIMQGTHSKLIVLRKEGDTWRIASEAPLDDRSCVSGELQDVAAPEEFASCAERHSAALDECDRNCDSPGNSCNVCPEEALCGLLECLEMEPVDDVCG